METLPKFLLGVTPREKIDIAHDYMFDTHPAGIPFLTQWKIEEQKGLGTACTDGQRIWYDPEWIGQLATNCVKAVVMHEVCHILFGHHFGRGDRNHKLWNIACDLAVNGHLKEYYKALGVLHHLMSDGVAGGIFPRSGKYIHAPAGMSSEWYYQWLIDQISNQPETPQPKLQSGDPGEGDPGEGDPGKGESSDGTPGESDESADGDPGEGDPADGEGSTSTQGTQGGEETPLDRKLRSFLGEEYEKVGLGEVKDDPGVDAADEDEAREQWEEQVSQAVILQKSIGGGMGNNVDIIDQFVAKRTNVSWAMLRQWISRSSVGGYNWRRPSRRHGWRTDVLLPNNRTKNLTKGVVMVDTSGSMGVEEMNEALRQIQKIVSEYRNAEITLVQCDRRIVDDSIKVFNKYDFPITHPHKWFGRGGTDMAPAINWVADNRSKFDWAIMVSDMEWEINWTPEVVPDTGLPTVYLAVNNEAVKPDHPNHHALAVKVAA